jgi:hypothetical protein
MTLAKRIEQIYKKRQKAHETLLLCDLELDKLIREERKDIGLEFKKWYKGGTEDIEDAIYRITNIKV